MKKKGMLSLSFILILQTIGVSLPSTVDSKEKEPIIKLELTDDKARSSLGFFSKYHIFVTLMADERLSLQQLQDAQTFSVKVAESGKSVPLRQVTFANFPKEEEGTKVYKEARLWADFRPDVEYLITIRYPDGKEYEAKTEILDNAAQSSIFEWMGDRTSFRINPSTSEEVESLGFKYDFDFVTSQWRHDEFRSLSTLRFSSNGEFSTKNDDDDYQSSLKAGINYDYRYQSRFELSLAGPQDDDAEIRQYVYPIGFRLKPVELESNRDFDVVDYTAKIQGAVAVPYSDLPVFWWHRRTGVNRAFFPLLMFAGYSFVQNVEESEGDRNRDIGNRFDLELIYNIPIANQIDFNTKWRSFTDIADGGFEDHLELDLVYYFDDQQTTGITLSYQRGGLPPEFDEGDSFRLGFSMKFF